MRYTLETIVDTKTDFIDYIKQGLNTSMSFGMNATTLNELLTFVGNVIYGYFYDDLVAYEGEDVEEVNAIFIDRLCYDINLKVPYWYRKYNYVKKLLTDADFNLLQTSKMTSSSTDTTKTAGGSLQKTATTPTGVSTGTAEDSIDIEISEVSDNNSISNITTTGFADKYTNAQQKFANAGRVEGERSGEIMREGSIDELLKVLEKLPSSFADEVSIALQKHFIFDYDGEMLGIYNN